MKKLFTVILCLLLCTGCTSKTSKKETKSSQDTSSTDSLDDSFYPIEANLFLLSASNIITITPNIESVIFDYNDWSEFSWFNQGTETHYRTLIQWDYNEDTENYELTITQTGGEE